MIYKIIRFLLKLFVPLLTRLEVHGIENIPKTGGVIAVGNHIGVLEGPLAYYFLDRTDIIMLVAKKHQRYAPARWFVKHLDAVWVDRYNRDFNAMRTILKRLQEGGVVVIAPEGTRSPDGTLQEGHDGASFLASKTGLPLLPEATIGTLDKNVKAHLLRLQRVPVIVRFGRPFTLPPIHGKDRHEALKQNTNEIMCRIAALLPPEYRGVYADYPRVQELLQD
jgi:1-acyl-sn-glycerol-3-phosphate acyltransferase